jgi:hypothetical protein
MCNCLALQLLRACTWLLPAKYRGRCMLRRTATQAAREVAALTHLDDVGLQVDPA